MIGSRGAFAQSWPARPIRIVVGLQAGGGTDVTMRAVAVALKDKLGQNIVVDNITGAGGSIASADVARAAPDGYTFEAKTISAAVINAFVFQNLSYHPINDFKAVSLVGRAPLVAVIPSSVPAANLREFLALLRANPGKYSYGSSGIGTIPHFAGEQFKQLADVDIVHVPYRGNGPALVALLSGEIAMIFDTVGSTKQYIEAGKIRGIGVTTPEPTEFMPDLPPLGSAIKGFALDTWFGLFAPAKTPDDIVARMSEALRSALQETATADQVRKYGYEPVGSSPADFDQFWRKQLATFAPMIKTMGIKPN